MFAAISRFKTLDSIKTGVGNLLPRARGHADVTFMRTELGTRAMRVFQDGAAKIRFPNVAPDAPTEAVLLNIAGGMAGGDSQSISLTLDAGAEAAFTTQACERIYPSLGDDAVMTTELRLRPTARLDWLPQPVIFFDRARLKREMQVHLSPDATLLAVESMIFGRAASGETVKSGALSDSWFIRRGKKLIHAERFQADGPLQTMLASAFALNTNRAMATIRYVAPNAESLLEEMRALLETCGADAAASAWNGLLLARILAPDGYVMNRALLGILTRFRGRPMPRAWTI